MRFGRRVIKFAANNPLLRRIGGFETSKKRFLKRLRNGCFAIVRHVSKRDAESEPNSKEKGGGPKSYDRQR